MTTHDTTSAASSADSSCRTDAAGNVTRSLLGYGVVAGPFYLVAGLVEALTRDGFDLTRHDLSLLANGPLGWIHVGVLVLSGLMTLAAAGGARRALQTERAGRWGPRLLAGYGLGLVLAGVFVADPMNGFPLGTPAGPPAAPTLHGTLHFVTGGLGFLCLIAATFAFATRQSGGRAWFSRATGVIYLAGFGAIASGSSSPWVVLGFWIAVIVGWAWLAAVSVELYRGTRR